MRLCMIELCQPRIIHRISISDYAETFELDGYATQIGHRFSEPQSVEMITYAEGLYDNHK